VQNAREIAYVLDFDVLLRAHDNDGDGALASCRAIVNTGRSLVDEPFLISQLVRIAIRAIALGKVERTLAQTQPSPAALAELQRLLEEEEPAPVLLIALRGERGGMDQLLQALDKGEQS